jgi:aminoacyl-tRNA hydrolase
LQEFIKNFHNDKKKANQKIKKFKKEKKILQLKMENDLKKSIEKKAKKIEKEENEILNKKLKLIEDIKNNDKKINNDEILVVHDELELPIGTVSLKWSGGLGGHNGLRSAKAVLGTADFWRLRFGISKPANANIADYVLSNFTADERIILAQEFAPTNEMFCKLLLSTDPNRILQGWSKKKIVEK